MSVSKGSPFEPRPSHGYPCEYGRYIGPPFEISLSNQPPMPGNLQCSKCGRDFDHKLELKSHFPCKRAGQNKKAKKRRRSSNCAAKGCLNTMASTWKGDYCAIHLGGRNQSRPTPESPENVPNHGNTDFLNHLSLEKKKKKEHDVKGHWRTLEPGKRVWVSRHKRGEDRSI